ncbi:MULTISPECIES: COG1470 family protein [Streptomyces]|uniref:COG1470 family protein n=1 Tax=Streptomyces TaxID=1883 RepID=UPI001E4590D4|nr:hypothetical protein [Streptomyces canarius]
MPPAARVPGPPHSPRAFSEPRTSPAPFALDTRRTRSAPSTAGTPSTQRTPSTSTAGTPSTRHPSRTPLALVTLLLPLVLLTSAPRAFAGSGGWSVAPLGAGRAAFYAEGAPGTVLRDSVSVTNRSRTPVTVRLRGTGVPTVFARSGLRVPPRTRAEVPFTLTVPPGAAPGDRTGAIVVRDAHGRGATVRVWLRVSGPSLAALTVEHPAVHADRITYELVNRGTTVLVPKLAVRADGLFGRVLDRAPRTLPVRLAPGARRTLSEPWPGRPVLDRVRVRLTVTAAGGAHDTTGTTAAYVPWGAVTGGAAAVAAGGAAVLLRTRHRRRRPARPGPRPGAVEPTGAVS